MDRDLSRRALGKGLAAQKRRGAGGPMRKRDRTHVASKDASSARGCSIDLTPRLRGDVARLLFAAVFGVSGVFGGGMFEGGVFGDGAGSVIAASVAVSFDAPAVAACRDVTPEAFQETNPDERLVETQIDISSLVQSGDETDLREYFYRLESPRQTLRIVDYAPKTTLASELAGNVIVENKQETNRGLGMTAAAPLDWPLKLNGSGELGSKTCSTERYELAPPMTMVAASGTRDRGHSVYFRLRRSRTTAFEGAKRFTLVMRVSAAWRADYLHLSCAAFGVAKRSALLASGDDTTVCGRRRFVVALYAEGDASAKAAAQRLVRAESDLWQTLSTARQQLDRRSRSTLAGRVSALFEGGSVVRASDDVAEAIVYGDAVAAKDALGLRLPPQVRQAAIRYAVARRALDSLETDGASDVQ